MTQANADKLVSFIMGVYNTKDRTALKRSVASMLDQTYPHIQVVLCDDVSTNGIYEFLQQEYGCNPKVKLLRLPQHGGLRTALNAAIDAADGAFIARQDDDDYSDLTRIEKEMAVLEAHPEYSFVSSALYKFDRQGIWQTLRLKEQPSKKDFAKHCQHVHPAALFRRSCLDRVGGYRIAPETIRCEDYDLFMRIYAAGMRGYNLQEPLYYYNKDRDERQRPPYRYKWNEAVVRAKGYKRLKLAPWSYRYVFRPLLAGLLSPQTVQKIKSRKRV